MSLPELKNVQEENQMKKYIVEVEDPKKGERASSGGIRGNGGRLVSQYTNPVPYREPAPQPAPAVRKQPKKRKGLQLKDDFLKPKFAPLKKNPYLCNQDNDKHRYSRIPTTSRDSFFFVRQKKVKS